MKRLGTLLLLGSILISACAGAATPAPTATAAPISTPAPTEPPTPAATETPPLPFTLTSTTFEDGGDIPDAYVYTLGNQCSGDNLSPQMAWVGLPGGTESLALIMIDPDGQNWVHWVQFNIPPDVTELPEATAGPEIGVKGRTSFYTLGYGGPCPPGGNHHYVFTLYALNTMLPLEEGASYTKVVEAMKGHILAETSITGMRAP